MIFSFTPFYQVIIRKSTYHNVLLCHPPQPWLSKLQISQSKAEGPSHVDGVVHLSSINVWPQNIWVFPKIGVSQNGWFIMENPIKMDDLGVPLFSETSIYETSKSYTNMSYQRCINVMFWLSLLLLSFTWGACFGSGMILSSSPHVSNPMLFEYSSWLLMKVKFRKWTKAYSKTNEKGLCLHQKNNIYGHLA